MRTTTFLRLVTLLPLLFLGCVSDTSRSEHADQLGSYLASKIAEYSGRPVARSERLALHDVVWTRREDKTGTSVLLCGDHFAAVDRYMRNILRGKPRVVTTNNFENLKVQFNGPEVGLYVEYSVRLEYRSETSCRTNTDIILVKPPQKR
jgi:hypothetical protein